jgi:preprotein translocase subunit SecA
MSLMAFHLLFPEEAKNESRTVTPVNLGNLPGHTFLFVEFYCVDPGCDCRRVMLNVIDTESQKHVATISHAFEPPQPPFDDEGQTTLDPMNPQSRMSDALLDLFEEMIANDEVYRQRLERHYKMWKSVVDDPTHPDHPKVRTKFHDDPDFEPAFQRQEPVRRDGPKLGPNDPCPCGSGKKYKKCCRQ